MKGPDEKPEVQLVGEDGNAFGILGKVSKALKRAGPIGHGDRVQLQPGDLETDQDAGPRNQDRFQLSLRPDPAAQARVVRSFPQALFQAPSAGTGGRVVCPAPAQEGHQGNSLGGERSWRDQKASRSQRGWHYLGLSGEAFRLFKG